jgi:5-hydroxyisourate hydrolase-like protein (transthyretin family)
MRRSTHTPVALVLVLLVAVFVVLFADVLAVSAAADPLPAGSGTVLTPVSPSTVSRPYSHSSFRVTSRLLDGAGQAIPGARIEILQQVSGGSQMQLVGTSITRPDGTFTALVPAGPSRLVDLAYRGPSGGVGYVAQTEVLENVTAGLRLRITPRRTTPTGTVRFEGQVLGVVPAHGVVVEVLVYYLGQWQPIRTPRTSGSGRLQVSYRFNHASGQFPFRLRVRDGQVGFPYGEACSEWFEVVI